MSGSSRSDWAFSVALAIIALALLRLMWPLRVDPILELSIAQNRVPIGSLDQPRNIAQRKTVAVDSLDLARDGRFAHARLGNLGYGDHFFVDVDRAFEVRKAGSYRFVVSSDDGFALEIDGRRICAYTQARALTTQSCAVLLEPGRHQFHLGYFQATGPAGLRVQYSSQTDSTLYDFGQASVHFTFPP